MCCSLAVAMTLVFAWGCAPQPSSIKGTIEIKLKKSKKARKRAEKESLTVAQRPPKAPPLFVPADGHSIRAEVTLSGLKPGKTEVVHLVWLKPGGKQLFRKVKEFVPDKKTESLRSSISISPDRERDPGKYAFKVYRHRRLLATAAFEIGEPNEGVDVAEES
jgi:hypothetical protein